NEIGRSCFSKRGQSALPALFARRRRLVSACQSGTQKTRGYRFRRACRGRHPTMLTQQELYLYNRQRIQDPCGHRLSYLNFEQEWVASRLWECGDAEPVTGVEDLLRRCAALVEAEKAAPPPSAEYVADHMTLDEFQVLVQEFAVDGLTEAQVFY